MGDESLNYRRPDGAGLVCWPEAGNNKGPEDWVEKASLCSIKT